MNNYPSVSGLISLFRSLSTDQQAQFLSAILTNPTHSKDQHPRPSSSATYYKNKTINHPEESPENIRFKDGVFCPRCGDTGIVKRGFAANGKQRFLCRACKHSFVATTNTTLQYSKKGLEVWLRYIDCMANQFSIRKSARICQISIPTSFNWRHKILDSLRNLFLNGRPRLNGIIEADETYFHLSFKGNRKMGLYTCRKPHKRGNAISKRGLSNEQVCVPCAVSVRGKAIAQIGKLGTSSLSALSQVLGNRIEPGSVLCSDRLRSYIEFCHRFHLIHNNSGLKHIGKLVDAKGGFIQHINSYHSLMKRFMRPFNGVATKYLNNYLVWYNEGRDAGYNEIILKKNIYGMVLKSDVYIPREFISLRDPVPVLA